MDKDAAQLILPDEIKEFRRISARLIQASLIRIQNDKKLNDFLNNNPEFEFEFNTANKCYGLYLTEGSYPIRATNPASEKLFYALYQTYFANSTSEAIRMIKQGMVYIDEVQIKDKDFPITYMKEYEIRIGKKNHSTLALHPNKRLNPRKHEDNSTGIRR